MKDENLSQQEERTELKSQTKAEIWKNFEIIEQIADSGMALVFKAKDLRMERLCALKVLKNQDNSDSFQKRFLQEAKLLSALEHEHIVKIFASGINDEKKPFFAMEWLAGNSLDKLLDKKNKIAIADFRQIFLQVLDAVKYAHEQGIIHRDIKPANIFVLDKPSDSEQISIKLQRT